MRNEPEFAQASVNYPNYMKYKGKKKMLNPIGMQPEKSFLWETLSSTNKWQKVR